MVARFLCNIDQFNLFGIHVYGRSMQENRMSAPCNMHLDCSVCAQPVLITIYNGHYFCMLMNL